MRYIFYGQNIQSNRIGCFLIEYTDLDTSYVIRLMSFCEEANELARYFDISEVKKEENQSIVMQDCFFSASASKGSIKSKKAIPSPIPEHIRGEGAASWLIHIKNTDRGNAEYEGSIWLDGERYDITQNLTRGYIDYRNISIPAKNSLFVFSHSLYGSYIKGRIKNVGMTVVCGDEERHFDYRNPFYFTQFEQSIEYSEDRLQLRLRTADSQGAADIRLQAMENSYILKENGVTYCKGRAIIRLYKRIDEEAILTDELKIRNVYFEVNIQ